MKQTKIVCTISDQHCEQDFLRHLFFAGMNVVRMNTAHATPEGIRKIIRNTRAVTPHLALLIDTKGPEVRTTGVKEPIAYKTDEQVAISGHPDTETTHDHVCVSCTSFANDVKVGDDVLFDDGALAMKVVGKEGDTLTARVLNDGTLGAHKSVNVPGEHIDLPALSDRDKRMIRLAIDQDIDFIAHSFVRSAKDVHAVQRILDAYHSDIKIISKIENQEGVDNIDEIIDASYGIMIARGDLGIEVPIEQIPGIQRRIIEKCIRKHKPVIVATQMLHTMINNPRPTRAEVTDIANAVFSHTDALMLSGETANGKYPLEAVQTMARVAEQAEPGRPPRGLPEGAFGRHQPARVSLQERHRGHGVSRRQRHHHGQRDGRDGAHAGFLPRTQPRAGHLLQGETAALAQPQLRHHRHPPAAARHGAVYVYRRPAYAETEGIHRRGGQDRLPVGIAGQRQRDNVSGDQPGERGVQQALPLPSARHGNIEIQNNQCINDNTF